MQTPVLTAKNTAQTPLGNYSPDWPIVFNTAKFKYVYFIAETKGSMETLQLKEIELKKISYAK